MSEKNTRLVEDLELEVDAGQREAGEDFRVNEVRDD